MPEEIKPLEQYKTGWTTDGRYRLDIARWPEAIVLTCETEGITLPKDERFPYQLGRVVVLTASLRPEAERFVEHAFSFYGPEVAAMALAALRKIITGLKDPDPNAPRTSNPPRGVIVN